MILFARNEAANSWLAEHPEVVGAGALVFALIFIGLGAVALVTKKAPTNRGKDLEGGNAVVMGFVWLGFGALCLLFGLYKIASALV